MDTTAANRDSTPWHERFSVERDRLAAEGKAALAAARALAPFAKDKAFADLKKLDSQVRKARAKLPSGAGPAAEARALLIDLEAWIAEAPEKLRRETGRRLKEFCEGAGLELLVLRRDSPVELRIPPFGVEIDFAKGKAKLLYARLPVAETAADADGIIAARERLLGAWDRDFHPERFHSFCRKAWRAARAAEGIEEGRVEILDFLPYLALQIQGEKFAIEPDPKNFRGYGRSRFAYDVNQLRERRMLDQAGWRLSLGVATGSTAQQKKRVIYFEDGRGSGEYKLTVSFVRSESQA